MALWIGNGAILKGSSQWQLKEFWKLYNPGHTFWPHDFDCDRVLRGSVVKCLTCNPAILGSSCTRYSGEPSPWYDWNTWRKTPYINWSWPLTYYLKKKKFKDSYTFWTVTGRALIFQVYSLWLWPFHWYQTIWPRDLDRDHWPSLPDCCNFQLFTHPANYVVVWQLLLFFQFTHVVLWNVYQDQWSSIVNFIQIQILYWH